jgi:hypothetical protein
MSDSETINIVVSEVNTAPVLTPLGDRNVTEGTLLTFAATATDPDTPTNTLTFSLEAGAPAGAEVNATNGVFTWMPTEAQGPSTNTITIRVTDNGSPALNDFETITVVVAETNSSPVLVAISNKSLNEGATLTFTNSATDADFPTNTLSFSLDPGAPAGATIIASSGVFTWTPSTNQAPSTNVVTVRVTDDGSPAKSDTTSFAIVVNLIPALRLTSIALDGNGLLTLSWDSQSGKSYRVQSTDSLSPINWGTLGDYNATNSTTLATNSLTGVSQRYYRVLLLN